MRRTKIVCTLGPASTRDDVLESMLRAGMDVARLNFSHGTYDDHLDRVVRLRAVAARMGRSVGILQDLCGPKIRMGEIPGGSVVLKDGEEVVFSVAKPPLPPGLIPVGYEGLARDVKRGDRVLLDDGQLEVAVLDVSGTEVKVRVLRGGTLKTHKGLNLPGIQVSAPSVTEKDYADLEWGLKHGVDIVALSFVRSPQDLDEVRKRINRESDPPLLIAKIEKPEAVEHLEAILQHADGAMVARGDLGVEMPADQVPVIQKKMIALANSMDKPVITATQMLESMTESPRPTRAEVSDVANAIFDGTDAVMLSGETAAGKFPVAAVMAMARIAETAEKYIFERGGYERSSRAYRAANLRDALSLGAERVVRDLQMKAIVVNTMTGNTARYVSSSRPAAPIIGLSPNPRYLGRMCLYWGVTPALGRDAKTKDDLMRDAKEAAAKAGLTRQGDMILVLYGEPLGARGTTNAIQVVRTDVESPTGLDRGSLIVERVKEEAVIVMVDREICMGCGVCVEGCPSRIFEMRGGKAGISRSGRQPCLLDNDWCAHNCPSGAIRVRQRPKEGWGPGDR